MGQLTSRQEIISEELNDPRTRDWFTLSVALREATKALAICIHHKISVIHKRSQQACGRTPPCTNNCSQKYESSRWCRMCGLWQNEISSLCEAKYKSNINWGRYHSNLWASNPYEFARVFIPRAHRLYYKSNEFHEDIRYTLSFLENCNKFDIPKEVIQQAWIMRNSFRRKGKMKVKNGDLNQAISILLLLLKTPNIQDHQAIPPAIKKLQELNESVEENGCCIS